MASGDSLLTFVAEGGSPPSAAFAALTRRNNHFLIGFDAATDESIDFSGVLPRHYGGGGITVRLAWAAASATSGNVVWDVQFERHTDDVQDLDSDGFAAVQSTTVATANVSGELSYDDIAFTDGAQIDSLAVGESFRLRVTRDANNASDTMAGDAQLKSVELRET